jgi:secondary thiamine-phosphate synthase enzyme
MRQAQQTLIVETAGKGLVDVTRPIAAWLAEQGIATGLLTVWCRHTSASLTVQENADPAVRRDIARFFDALAPEDAPGDQGRFEHADEGPDDMPAHLRAMLTDTQLSIPVTKGRLALGTWQAVYLFEHRARPRRREIVLHLLGE